MNRAPKEILSRLGPDGLAHTLDDLLDQKQLVRLANACGLKYRGMRIQSQGRQRLLGDLVKKSGDTEAARKAILHALRKETTAGAREWAGLGREEKAKRLCDEELLRSKGKLGLHLYLLAASADAAELDGVGHLLAREHLVRIATNGNGSALSSPGDSREQARLKRNVTELEKKSRHLDAQLSKSRESQKSFKRDLIERKGELAESRMLVERLRRELSAAQTAAQVASEKKPQAATADKTFTTLARTVRELASQQKHLAHALAKTPRSNPGPERALTALLEDLRSIRKELTVQQRTSKAESSLQTRRIEELRSEVRAQVAALGATAKTAKRARARAEGQRVGVFIDVQNMYYAARQLKGKLDFDALLSAAVTRRRLIQATAYVVESKDNDQSQFIKMLQQRAIKVQRKNLKVRADGSMKGDWDMELALDILDAAPSLDVVVLVSGDGDFTSLVKRVKAMGPRVEVIAFPLATAKALVEAADRFQPLDRKFMIYPKRMKSRVDVGESAKPLPAAKAGERDGQEGA